MPERPPTKDVSRNVSVGPTSQKVENRYICWEVAPTENLIGFINSHFSIISFRKNIHFSHISFGVFWKILIQKQQYGSYFWHSYRTPPPPRRRGFSKFFFKFFFRTRKFLRIHKFFTVGKLLRLRNFSSYLRLRLFIQKITCKIFSSKSGNITQREFPGRVRPLDHEYCGHPARRRSCAQLCAAQGPSRKCMGKIQVKNFHIPNLAILYITRFVSVSSIEVPKAPTRENVR